MTDRNCHEEIDQELLKKLLDALTDEQISGTPNNQPTQQNTNITVEQSQ